MAELPKKHAKPCPKCGGVLWLKDYDPSNLWYGCENYKSQGCKGSISASEVQGNGGQRQGGGVRQETSRTSKIICPCCAAEIIVDVHASSLGTVKPKQHAAKVDNNQTDEEVARNDGIPF